MNGCEIPLSVLAKHILLQLRLLSLSFAVPALSKAPGIVMGLCSSHIDVHMVDNPLGSSGEKQPQPQTKQALRAMLERYCKGSRSYGEPNTWDVTLIKDMKYLFAELENFNAPVNSWDVSGVWNMCAMFEGATSFNQILDNWDMSSVTIMNRMFHRATSFNCCLSAWDTSNVTDMYCMFKGATSYNQPMEAWGRCWDTSKVVNMKNMFQGAISFNQPLKGWNLVSVEDNEGMFDGADAMEDVNKPTMS